MSRDALDVGTGVFVTPQVPEDGDLVDAASVTIALDEAMIRTRYAKDVIDREHGNPGIRRCRTVTSVTQLRALEGSDHHQADFCQLMSNALRPQLFFYNVLNNEPDDGVRVIKPNDVTTSNGRWVDLLRSLFDATGNLLAPDGLIVLGSSAAFAQGIGVQGGIGTDTIIATDLVWCESNLTVDGAANCNIINASGTTTCNGALRVKGGGTIESSLACSGVGHIRIRAVTISANADATVSIADGDQFYLPAGVITADRTITLGSGSAGAVLKFKTVDTAHFLTIDDGSNVLPLKRAPGSKSWAEYTRFPWGWAVTGSGE